MTTNPTVGAHEMKMVYLAVLAACLLIVGVAHAEPQKNLATMGIGTYTCAQFANVYRNAPQLEVTFFAWARASWPLGTWRGSTLGMSLSTSPC
jgi:hypothetical protein